MTDFDGVLHRYRGDSKLPTTRLKRNWKLIKKKKGSKRGRLEAMTENRGDNQGDEKKGKTCTRRSQPFATMPWSQKKNGRISKLYPRASRVLAGQTADLKHRMRGVWRDAELVDPNTHNNKLATYYSWVAIHFSRNERLPINVPRISILICPNMLCAI